MATDARLQHPAARRAPGVRPMSNHLRLVPLPSARSGRADPPEHWRAEGWSEPRIRAEMAEFYESPWGACLPVVARVGLEAVLLPATAPRPFDGYSGVAFLDDVLDTDTLERHQAISPAALHALPTALRAWVRFNRRTAASGDAALTLALLEHVDHLEPAWQAAVRAS